jgi:hypothetical protein
VENIFVIATQFTTNVQLEDLTYRFYFWISCHKLLKESIYFCVFTLKHVSIWDEFKKNQPQKIP